MDVREIIRYLFSLRSRHSKVKLIALAFLILCILNIRTCSAESGPGNSSVTVDISQRNISSASDGRSWKPENRLLDLARTVADYLHREMDESAGTEVARTFGRPLRKLQSALLPIMFKLGVMSTLIFLTFLLVLKGVGIGLLLLMFKVGAAFAKFKSEWAGSHHGHGHHGWSPHPKEVHLHVVGHHGYGHGYEVPHYGHDPWSRTETITGPGYNRIISPYGAQYQGSNTINTPYGHYVRTGDPTAPSI